jgi:protein-arginine kinase activator protein McsA
MEKEAGPLLTYYCLCCGKLKQGDWKRVELNVCEECATAESDENDSHSIQYRWDNTRG